jgi:hypothetical protein
MAHSYGGAVVLELVCDRFIFHILFTIFFQAARYTSEFDKHVFAVALTDSPMRSHTIHFSTTVLRMLHKVLIFKKIFEFKKISF